jgi:hypothetical protein
MSDMSSDNVLCVTPKMTKYASDIRSSRAELIGSAHSRMSEYRERVARLGLQTLSKQDESK